MTLTSSLYFTLLLLYNPTENSSYNLPSYLQTNIIAQVLSIGGEGVISPYKTLTYLCGTCILSYL